MTRANATGAYAVYVIVKTVHGRFFVNTGITTIGKLTGGMVFPPRDPSGARKAMLLAKYITDIERVCLQQELQGVDNATLKRCIQKEVFGLTVKAEKNTLADFIRLFAKTKRPATAVLYNLTERRVLAYDSKVTLHGVDAAWLERFRTHCLDSGMRINGAAKELRNIRAVFNYARKKGATSNYPFLDYSIVEEETLPNNLGVEDLRRLRDYPCEDWQRQYVDFFFLSFYPIPVS